MATTSNLSKPTNDDIKQLSAEYKLGITNLDDLRDFASFIESSVENFNVVNNLPLHIKKPAYKLANSRKPVQSENQYNAWCWLCDISYDSTDSVGQLKGKNVAVKDNVAVAGVPMINGSDTMLGFVPDFTATVVERCLRAGGHIVGKTVCEDLCLSGSSFNTACGPVLNPWDPTRSAGGSSSGSAVAVCAGLSDLAIGGDQGGSVRIPASNCGIIGLKPTYGLVPYTGAVPIEMTIDHLGPMATTVYDAALMLEVIAGFDNNNDSRQPSIDFPVPKYTDLLEKEVKPIKIGVIRESFDMCTDDIVQCIKHAVDLIKADAKVELVDEISIPVHRNGLKIWNAVAIPGLLNQMIDGAGFGTGLSGYLPVGLSEKFGDGLATKKCSLSVSAKAMLLLGGYLQRTGHHNAMYARGQTLALQMRKEYDMMLKKYDVLLTPTLPFPAGPLPTSQSTVAEKLKLSLTMLDNTSPFNVTHHPALTLNAGFSTKNQKPLPVGVQLIGRHWDEVRLLQVAHVIEHILKPEQIPLPLLHT